MKAKEAITLPREVRDLAERLGATTGTSASSVMLTQRGTMRDHPDKREMKFRAVQTINLQCPAFEWRASIGPFGCISVLDALKDGEAQLEVRALGLLRITGVRGGIPAAKGEIMRYLAEIAWAPDAIFCNPALAWTVVDGQNLRVAAGQGPARGEVGFGLDENGRIGNVQAEDRPRNEGTRFVERPWHGRFFDYRKQQGRWVPFAGEVGWTLDGQTFIAWRGELLSWASA